MIERIMRALSTGKYSHKSTEQTSSSQIYCDTWHVSSNVAVIFSQSIKQTAFGCTTDLRRQKLAAGDSHHDAAKIKSALIPPLCSLNEQLRNKRMECSKSFCQTLSATDYSAGSKNFTQLTILSYVEVQKASEFPGNILNESSYELGCRKISFRI